MPSGVLLLLFLLNGSVNKITTENTMHYGLFGAQHCLHISCTGGRYILCDDSIAHLACVVGLVFGVANKLGAQCLAVAEASLEVECLLRC